jgi:methionyl aminopeptidase
MPWDIPVNSEFDIQGIRAAARAAREVLDLATAAVSKNGVGMTTEELDELVHTETIKRGGYPSPLNYHGFPKSVCTSINEVVCHGIPAPNVVLKEGDTLNIDVTVYLNGYHGDCSEMACVGEVDEAGKKLIQTTYDAWQVV